MIAVGFTVIVLVVAVVIVRIVAGAAGRAAAGRLAAGIAGWLAITGAIAASGVIALDGGVPRVMALPITAIVGGLLVLRSTRGRAVIARAPRVHVMALQAFRIPVELVLWALFLDGVVPVQMTFEGRNFDVLVGLTAIPMAVIIWGRARHPRLALVWHACGLALLANIVATAILSTPGPLRVFANEPANTIIGTFPYVWLPAFLVPVALFGHVAGIRQARA